MKSTGNCKMKSLTRVLTSLVAEVELSKSLLALGLKPGASVSFDIDREADPPPPEMGSSSTNFGMKLLKNMYLTL